MNNTAVFDPIGILADDLTGAIDVAAPFAARGLPTLVTLSLQNPLPSGNWKVLSCNTKTRNTYSRCSNLLIRNAVRFLGKHGVRLHFQKIDSTMRGQPGLDISSAMLESKSTCAFITPVFPAMGRTMCNGVLYVRGLPLKQSNEGNDPLSRPHSSSVVDLLERQGGHMIGLVHLSDIVDGEKAIFKRIYKLMEEGRRWILFDAISQEHLERIEKTVRRKYPGGLLVGSAGLASSMAKRLNGSERPSEFEPSISWGTLLVTCGSVNKTSLDQLQFLSTLKDIHYAAIDTQAVLGSHQAEYEERQRQKMEVIEAIDAGKDIILGWERETLSKTFHHSELDSTYRSQRLNDCLKKIAGEIFMEKRISCLLLIGGDTTFNVLKELSSNGIELKSELQVGIPIGQVVGGIAEGASVVTKAGGFGETDTLATVVEQLRALRYAS